MTGFCTGGGERGDFPARRMLDFRSMRPDPGQTPTDPGRRRMLAALAATGAWCAGLGGSVTAWARAGADAAAGAARGALERLPGKWPLIRLTHRPPNYETPLEHLRTAITPNEAFFVRYHHAVIPEVDAGAFRLEVGGAGVSTPLSLSLEQLRSEFKPVAVTAVCQCSGNRRGLFRPRVAGLQWEHGAMGCAEWRGVRLADVLERAGLKASALEVSFDAADAPPLEGTPDFIKSLPRAKALHPDTLLAFEMNGEPLPRLNGFPLRLVVPGWTATYWIKHLTRIEALEGPDKGFWMASAYRMPRAAFPLVERFPSQESGERAPVTEIAVNSLVTGSEPGGARAPCRLLGIAWDAGHGLERVEVSLDGGRRWDAAQFGPDLGRYAFRTWEFEGPMLPPGRHEAWVRAANRIGQVQVPEAIPNPSGYQHNAWQRVTLEVPA
jgi:DMSO/TMAO reductase YedYZ molybdopterin-dependent catalytic subunit